MTITVRNQDIPKLSCVLYVMQDVSATEHKRMWAQDRLWNITQRITGIPGSGGIPSGFEKNFADIVELEEKYEAECGTFIQELKEAEEILNRMENRQMRTFVTMKYVLHIPDKKIMRELNMGRRRLEMMRRAVENAESMEKVQWE